jgi:hypothetical protein
MLTILIITRFLLSPRNEERIVLLLRANRPLLGIVARGRRAEIRARIGGKVGDVSGGDNFQSAQMCRWRGAACGSQRHLGRLQTLQAAPSNFDPQNRSWILYWNWETAGELLRTRLGTRHARYYVTLAN